jgi:hypothetical protein
MANEIALAYVHYTRSILNPKPGTVNTKPCTLSQCAQYEEVLQMANEIALAYEQRSSRRSDHARDQGMCC